MYVQNFTSEEDRKIVENLYMENRQSYYFTAWKILSDVQKAEQAVYTGLLLFVNNFELFRDLEYRSLEILAGITVKNEARRRALKHVEREKETTPLAVEEQDKMATALLKLPELERDILLLYYAVHLEIKQIGLLMQVPEEQVRAAIYDNSKYFSCI